MQGGDLQSSETFSDIETSVLDIESLKILLMVSNNNKRIKIRTLDINHVFLYADLKDEIYIDHPPGKNFCYTFEKGILWTLIIQ